MLGLARFRMDSLQGLVLQQRMGYHREQPRMDSQAQEGHTDWQELVLVLRMGLKDLGLNTDYRLEQHHNHSPELVRMGWPLRVPGHHRG